MARGIPFPDRPNRAKIFTYDRADEAITKITHWAAHCPVDQIDFPTSVDAAWHGVVLEADSFNMDKTDLGRWWLTQHRWNLLVRQYIDPTELTRWLEKTSQIKGAKGRGQSVFRTNVVQPRGGGNAPVSRRWGSCILTLSYKATPRPHIFLHSRTTYLGFLAAADMSVAWVMANMLGAELGVDPREMGFTWVIENMQFHHFRSMAYLGAHPQYETFRARGREFYTKEKAYGLWGMLRWIERFDEMDAKGMQYSEHSYMQAMRYRAKLHAATRDPEWIAQFGKPFDPMPSLMTTDLDMKAIWR